MIADAATLAAIAPTSRLTSNTSRWFGDDVCDNTWVGYLVTHLKYAYLRE